MHFVDQGSVETLYQGFVQDENHLAVCCLAAIDETLQSRLDNAQ
jgi:hypothetical protein